MLSYLPLSVNYGNAYLRRDLRLPGRIMYYDSALIDAWKRSKDCSRGTLYRLGLLIAEIGGQVVGTVTFKQQGIAGDTEIGYGIAPDHRGNGYATLGVRLALRHLTENYPDTSTVIARVSATNAGSVKVLVRNQFGLVQHIERLGLMTYKRQLR